MMNSATLDDKLKVLNDINETFGGNWFQESVKPGWRTVVIRYNPEDKDASTSLELDVFGEGDLASSIDDMACTAAAARLLRMAYSFAVDENKEKEIRQRLYYTIICSLEETFGDVVEELKLKEENKEGEQDDDE